MSIAALGSASYRATPGGILYPAGLNPLTGPTGRPWSGKATSATDVEGAEKWKPTEWNQGNYSIVDSVTATGVVAPFSPPWIGQAFYPAGFGSGSSPIGTSVHFFDQFNVKPLYTKLYVRSIVMVSAAFEGQSSGVNKECFAASGSSAGAGNFNFYTDFHGVGTGGNLAAQMTLQNVPGQSNRQLVKNMGPAGSNVLTRGAWMDLEYYMVLNSAAGVNDGTFAMALNGVQFASYTDVIYLGTGETGFGFVDFEWSCTWGGGVGQSSLADMWMWHDNIFLAAGY